MPRRFWQVIEKHKVNIFYTAPTAIRALMGAGPEFADKYEMPSLRLLGSVGEPINPEAWLWYHKHVGKGRCEIVDTWWQTETGGHMITPLPGAIATKPGSATKPFFGVQPVVLSPEGKLQEQAKAEGVLAIADSWPGQMRTVYGDHQRFVETYFATVQGLLLHRRRLPARRGRLLLDHRPRRRRAQRLAATASAPPRSRARWSRIPRSPRRRWSAIRTTSRGRASTAYVTLMAGETGDDALKRRAAATGCGRRSARSRRRTSSSSRRACPRRARARSCGASCARSRRTIIGALGDTTTLADPGVVDDLISNRKNK